MQYRRAEGQTGQRHLPEHSESKKRKRSNTTSADDGRPTQSIEAHDHDGESPKRRATNMDSAVDRSPTARWNRGEPPPPPRPEIEAGLAESLQRTLQNEQQAQAEAQAQARAHARAQAQAEAHARAQAQAHAQAERQAQVEAGAESPSPPAEAYGQHQQHYYSPDQDQDQEMDMDPKKRKRNFSNRTKTGCHTCRNRKKKCDERKPMCQNCERGGFPCGGYGPKPPGGFKSTNTNTRLPVALQSKPPYEPTHGPTGYYPSPRTAALALAYNPNAQLTEKDKMLLGRPFLHFIDTQLLKDREECKGALERYNDAARSTSHVSSEERGRFFKSIIEPSARPEYVRRDEIYTGPKGHIGNQTIVESPFTCDYGYNVHIGEEIVIQAGCYMQDACEIRIGDRTLIGPNVRFYGITASVDAKSRRGTRTALQGGAIIVGEDCFIGADVIIMPFRKIGNGAVVGAGSVVIKDVKDNTVVAGNPAKMIRRIEPGPNIDRHHPDIQEQNDRMLHEMLENAKRHPDR
ncbi:hypothetical protein LTR85_006962 [Meristemomyces frigidus]|nr:hypothetical protein LTR85_006962 [Meristemomyces frigidus]